MNKLTEKNIHNIIHFLLLIFILSASVLAFLLFQGNHYFQLIIILMTGVAYVLWGILYHYYKHDLHLKVMLEYVVIAVVAVILLWTVIFY